MKKIYTFTLEGDDYPSSKYIENLRLVAHFLYHEILNYGNYISPLNLNKNIRYNELNEGINHLGIKYYFDSDECQDNFINYEPFIVGENSFGFTVNDDMINEDTISVLLQYVLSILGLNYEVRINSLCYDSRDNDDERYRSKAVKEILKRLGYKASKKVSLVRSLGNNRHRNNVSLY